VALHLVIVRALSTIHCRYIHHIGGRWPYDYVAILTTHIEFVVPCHVELITVPDNIIINQLFVVLIELLSQQ